MHQRDDDLAAPGAARAVGTRRPDAGEVGILDVRDAREWAAGHIAGAVWIPFAELEERLDELDAGQEWVCVCPVGRISDLAADMLQDAGLQATNMRGGLLAWSRLRLPLTKERGTPKA
jgi:rhodanese-related sulfurtransferase